MIDTIGAIAFGAIVLLILALLGLTFVGAFYEIKAEIAESRKRERDAQ